MTLTDKSGPPYLFDFFQDPIDFHFNRGNAIVLINAANWDGAGQINGLGSFQILNGASGKPKATYLGQSTVVFQSATDSGAVQPAPVWAFKVNVNSGEFLSVTAGTLSSSQISGGRFISIAMSVYAIDPDLGTSGSLQRAFQGAKLTAANDYVRAPQNYAFFTHGSDLPSQADPPGLLWSGSAPAGSGEQVTFKVRYANHRAATVADVNPNTQSLPNKMWQLYPLGASRTLSSFTTVSGYFAGVYRLDKKGTGPSYGIGPKAVEPNLPIYGGTTTYPGANGFVLDPAWFQPVSHFIPFGDSTLFDAKGIPYGDPPPLIGSDNPSKDGGLYPPFNDGTPIP